jgi:hypothetical protein
MWRDDVDEIFKILSGLGQNSTLFADDYQLDTAEDLRDLPTQTVGALTITVGDQAAVLRLAGDGATLRVKDPDQAMRGALLEVRDVARRCRRRTAFLTKRAIRIGLFVAGATRLPDAVVLLVLA